jgi:hypothetical protein
MRRIAESFPRHGSERTLRVLTGLGKACKVEMVVMAATLEA